MKIEDLSNNLFVDISSEESVSVNGGDAISDYINSNSIFVSPQQRAAARQSTSQLNLSLFNNGGAYAVNSFWTNLGVGIATGQIRI
jgi:hypothetical protein